MCVCPSCLPASRIPNVARTPPLLVSVTVAAHFPSLSESGELL